MLVMPAYRRRAQQPQEPKHCQRCDYHWTPRVPDPVVCPACLSRYWKTKARPGNYKRGSEHPMSVKKQQNA